MKKLLCSVFFFLFIFNTFAQSSKPILTVDKIMQDPKTWIGTSPSQVQWSEDSKTIYFQWNPDKEEISSLYGVNVADGKIFKVSPEQKAKLMPFNAVYNKARTKALFLKEGDIFLKEIPNGNILQLTSTGDFEFSPRFSLDESKVIFQKGDNLFSINLKTGAFTQITDFKRGSRQPEPKKDEQDKWLENDQLRWIQVLKERKDRVDNAKKRQEAESKFSIKAKKPLEIYLQNKSVENLTLSPDERFVTYRLAQRPEKPKIAIVPNYVTQSGYTEDINTRTKVGSDQGTYEFWVYDIQRDTTFAVDFKDLPNISKKPEFLNDYEKTKKEAEKPRKVVPANILWSEDGKKAVLVVNSMDNKDRWYVDFDVKTGKYKNLVQLHDEAWIGGPGIGGFVFGSGTAGWLPDNKTFYFQSEETGYSHLYTINVETGVKKALTSGKYEVRSVELSKDKKFWYLTTSEVHPGEDHFYKMPLEGGKAVKLTNMTGGNDIILSPDEKYLANLYSYSNKPTELYVAENKENTTFRQLTSSLTEDFKAYPWRDPEVLTFKARDGADVYARLYKPENAKENAPAVIFVHGAGYLQNAHKRWSSYFREYMFHNLLVDKGYYVLDIDYRASAGYGRDWRTGIYRFMGGKDLDDHVDGAKFLVEKYKVNPKKIGIYGGSYGGFITLMAMFTTPDVFAAGAALRPVTDWAHYNHGYTNNILNSPVLDSIAYAKSSPIYHAEGLKGALLICHGMIDVNVHFQDVVRLAQRLIELRKENWELAVYPLEDHGFVEPTSWADEYRRILKLFEQNLRE